MAHRERTYTQEQTHLQRSLPPWLSGTASPPRHALTTGLSTARAAQSAGQHPCPHAAQRVQCPAFESVLCVCEHSQQCFCVCVFAYVCLLIERLLTDAHTHTHTPATCLSLRCASRCQPQCAQSSCVGDILSPRISHTGSAAVNGHVSLGAARRHSLSALAFL